VLGQEALQRSTAQEKPERREEVASFQYYRNFSNQRSNKHHIATDGHNAGLVNNNVLCYANAIFQIIASCAIHQVWPTNISASITILQV